MHTGVSVGACQIRCAYHPNITKVHWLICRGHLQQLTHCSTDVRVAAATRGLVNTQHHMFQIWQGVTCVVFVGFVAWLSVAEKSSLRPTLREVFVSQEGQPRFTSLTDRDNKPLQKSPCSAAWLVNLKQHFPSASRPHAGLNESIYSPAESGLEICFY